MLSDDRALWSPALSCVVRTVIRYGCTLCSISVTQVRCDELTDRLDVGAYVRTGLRELEAYVQDQR